MTIAERLNSKLLGLVPDVDGLLVDQGLIPDEKYEKEDGNSSKFQLAFAYGLYAVLMSPNLSEGDWSRSWGDRSALEKLTCSIFNRFAPDENPLAPQLVNISNRW
jgi:hypothetical protein